MKVSNVIYNRLLKHNIEHVFMYSGGSIMPLIDCFYNGPIKYYVNSHEQNCGHAATGYAKSTGKAGISIVTSGPGVTNSITPLLDAKNDSTPFILLSGNVSLNAMGKDSFQEAPSVEITKPVTKWSYCVTNLDEIEDVIDEAFFIANDKKKGSVHIDLPKCILTSDYNKTYKKNKINEINEIKLSNEYNHNFMDINKIVNIILNAKSPILYVGQGCNDAYKELRDLAINYKIPVTTTLHALGIFDEDNPLALGMCGMHGSVASNYSLQEADTIIAVGSRFDDRTTGNLDKYAPKCKNFIHINIEPNEINKVINTNYNIVGDCKKILNIILNNLNRGIINIDRNDWINKILYWKKKYPFIYKSLDFNIKTQDVLIELNKQIKINSEKYIITSGVGNHQMMTSQFITWKHPKSFISSGSLGVMGVGLPYAIGCQIGNPDKIVIDIDGDSSFLMTLSDLKTIVENNLPIKILIMNNNSQDMVRVWETLFFNERITATKNERNPNFSDLAKSFGLESLICNNINSLSKDLEYFLNYSNGPILLQCDVIPDYCIPLVPPGKALDEMVLYNNDFTLNIDTNKSNECPS